jgi:hypothetical protein
LPSGNMPELIGLRLEADRIDMKWILLGLCVWQVSFCVLADETSELRQRLERSRAARAERLQEATELAARGLESVASQELGCSLEPTSNLTPRERFIVVGVSGFGTNEEGDGEPSGAHDNLPLMSEIAGTYRLTHGANNARLDEVLSNFNCSGGVQGTENLGLIIMANSWGAGKANKLARRYQERCGREVELFVMVDGINKPIPTAYGKRPPARRCVNYYQRRSTLIGRAIEGCENHDLSQSCQDGGIAECHIEVEWRGSALGAQLIRDQVLGDGP